MSAKHVVFGTGAIGRAIMEELLRRGESVRMVNRSGLMDELPAGVELVAADLYSPPEVGRVTSGAEVVYQSAQPHYYEWPEKFPPLQRSIIDGLSGSGIKLVIVENTYMYGAMDGSPFTEACPHNAHTRKGKVRAEMSAAALAAHRDGRLRVTLGRGSDFFGPWGFSTSMGDRVFYPLLKGKPAQLGGRLNQPHTHTYLGDFGRALVVLGERGEADGQAWHVPNDMPSITQGELVTMAAETAGVKPRMSSMGKTMLWMGGLFIPEARESVEMLYEFERPYIVDSSKFERTFCLRPTPMREAVRETVAWFKSHPQSK